MLQTLHEDLKESYQLVENGHPMTPLKADSSQVLEFFQKVVCL